MCNGTVKSFTSDGISRVKQRPKLIILLVMKNMSGNVPLGLSNKSLILYWSTILYLSLVVMTIDLISSEILNVVRLKNPWSIEEFIGKLNFLMSVIVTWDPSSFLMTFSLNPLPYRGQIVNEGISAHLVLLKQIQQWSRVSLQSN